MLSLLAMNEDDRKRPSRSGLQRYFHRDGDAHVFTGGFLGVRGRTEQDY